MRRKKQRRKRFNRVQTRAQLSFTSEEVAQPADQSGQLLIDYRKTTDLSFLTKASIWMCVPEARLKDFKKSQPSSFTLLTSATRSGAALCLKQDVSISSKAGCGGVCLGSQLCGSGGRRIAAGSASVRVTVGDGGVEHIETHPTPEGLRDSRGVETRYDCTRKVRGVSGAGRPLCGPGDINSLCFLS